MVVVSIIIYILNIADLVFTSYLIKKFGLDIEFNPLGRFLYKHNIISFIKIIGVLIFLSILLTMSKYYKRKLATTSLWILLVIFLALVIYHIILLIKINKILK